MASFVCWLCCTAPLPPPRVCVCVLFDLRVARATGDCASAFALSTEAEVFTHALAHTLCVLNFRFTRTLVRLCVCVCVLFESMHTHVAFKSPI